MVTEAKQVTVPRPEPGGDAGRSRPALWLIGAVVAGALGLRFVYLVDYQSSPLFATAAGPDVTEYYEWALAILAGQWLWAETPFHAPLYAYFLAGLYAVTGQTLAAVRFGQLLLGLAALALLSFSTGRRLGWRIGIATAALWALYVPVVYYEAELFAEGLAVFLNSCVLALLLGSERPGRRRCVVAAQDRKEARRDSMDVESLGIARSGQVHTRLRHRRQVFEAPVERPPVLEVGRGHAIASDSRLEVLFREDR